MEIIKVSKLDSNLIKKVVKVLKSGGVIVFPTETAYGLGGDCLNRKVINRIYKIKGRKFTKPLPLISSSINQVRKFCFLNLESLKLAKKYWPGPLTLVLKKKKILPKSLTAGLDKVGIRVSSNKLSQRLARGLGRPIISTSANLAGRKECYSIEEILKQFKNKKIDLILDAGRLPKRSVSTVVEVVDEKIEVLRTGKIKI